MICLIEALNYRCLHDIQQTLGPFHVLVGPNASGKTTFLDVVAFLGTLVSKGIERAIEERTSNFHDLVWRRSTNRFELAIEALIPDELKEALSDGWHDAIRYEVSVGLDDETKEVSILAERVSFKQRTSGNRGQEPFQLTFPSLPDEVRGTLLSRSGASGTRTIVNKVQGGNDNYYSEVTEGKGKGWMPSFKLGPRRSALANLPEDETRFPVSTWLKQLLSQGVQQIVLNSALMRKASPPGQTRTFKPDGSNLPWVIQRLHDQSSERFAEWLGHLQTVFPELETIRTVERQDDKHRYLMVRYRDGLEVPSWGVSDGMLRLLALTLPAYLTDLSGVFLIEEPENGIHPRAVECLFQSLSSVYEAQVLLATHSPVILSVADVDQILCFGMTKEGSTDIVSGREHPALRDWHGEENLSVLFAGGVLG